MYLVQRGRRWWAFHDVPKGLEETLGVKARFAANLDTVDRKTAENRAAALELQWRRRIEAARRVVNGEAATDAEWWNAQLVAAADVDKPHVIDRIKEEAQEIARGYVEPFDPDQKGYADNQQADRFFEVATGQMVKFDANIDDWIGTLRNAPKSIDMKRSNARKFAARFKYVQDVRRGDVQRWIDEQMQSGKKPATIKRMLSELRGYWAYLQSLEVAADDTLPFDKLTFPKVNAKEARQDKRLPFAPKDVVRLLKAATRRGDAKLADLITLAMWTGCRLEELCSLEAANATPSSLEIVDAKTEAGIRKVPVHPKLAATVRRLKRDGDDGYLISGLPADQYGDRGPSIGKHFTRLKSSLGFGRQYVFHSIRHTVATLLKEAGVQEAIAADLLGHEHEGFTFGVYGGRVPWKVLKEAVEKLRYPDR